MVIGGILILSIVLICFLTLAIIFSKGKGAFLIAGYNTMSQEDKDQYDTVALCKFMGKYMFFMSFCLALFLPAILYDIEALFIIGGALIFISTLALVIYMQLSDQFSKK